MCHGRLPHVCALIGEQNICTMQQYLKSCYEACIKNKKPYNKTVNIFRKIEKFVDAYGEANIYNFPSFADIISKKYSPYAPLWTNLMGRFVDKEHSSVSNSTAEGYFNIVKNNNLDGNRNIRLGDYIRISYTYKTDKQVEIDDEYLDGINQLNIDHNMNPSGIQDMNVEGTVTPEIFQTHRIDDVRPSDVENGNIEEVGIPDDSQQIMQTQQLSEVICQEDETFNNSAAMQTQQLGNNMPRRWHL